MGNQANDHYAALERLYSERRWAEVEASAEVLLAEADGDLRARVLLLLGHTRLHGFNDAATAAEHYRRVVAAEPEALLLGIAQDGLNQCLAAEGPSPSNAMPWLEAFAAPEIAQEPLQNFPGFIQPVETFENLTGSENQLLEAPAEPAGPSPSEMTDEPSKPKPLSPEESAELAKGLLRVVIQPN
jgi:hypothetical protein